MKLAFQLAYKNLIGAGLKTWLNVAILAFTFLLIIFYNGFIDGWNRQALVEAEKWEYGEGQLLNENYDPRDPFTIKDGYGKLPSEEAQHMTPILLRQGSIYPDGRMFPIMIKGIEINQDVLAFPADKLVNSDESIPILIGKRLAKSTNLEVGDQVLMRWRDKNGTFDAANVTVVEVFKSDVASIDAGQIYMSLDKLYEITGLQDVATMYIGGEGYVSHDVEGWVAKDKEELSSGLTAIINTKKASGSILYILLLAIALLAIFDTQVLSIFRRQKEIGTYISLGMTRIQVVKLFTVEGGMYSLLAAIVAIIVGVPLFWYVSKVGISMPSASQSTGVTIADVIHPYFSLSLIVTTLILVIASATIVSYMPSRKIAKMDPVNALKGKIQ
ncbi:ABC transporter permease [Portibacter lacus]|uniref:ABC3 transporter permease C-terminal domain-containing protein n=1 Tax=Portibacter lacus TaxID=1099794 RepID=A0AA37WG87_9BACT|nr:FtsX-like permease family protein [Portibacter lacus]GLR19482.1 hypothetical protein GCM10007940_40980 [Portibacter lacus]